MSISVHVHLLSGASVTLATEPEESVTCLCQRAQDALKVGKGRLLTTSGETLAGGTVRRARLRDNDLLTLPSDRFESGLRVDSPLLLCWVTDLW